MEDTVFGVLYRRIGERREALANHVVNGGAPDYVAYAKAVAQHEAYVTIEEDLKELEKRFMDQ
jgi:alanine-alpha-ketoisovalerate/valine-pyruvate aminotransferase